MSRHPQRAVSALSAAPPLEVARELRDRLPAIVGSSPRLVRKVAHLEAFGASNLGALFDRERMGPSQAHVVLGPPLRSEFVPACNARFPVVNLASCAYLGLGSDERIRRAAMAGLERFGTQAGGARPLSGTTAEHLAFEGALARFLGTTGAATFSSGYLANISTLVSLLGSGDVILLDRLAHRSLHDGALLSGAELRRFRHNDVRHLEVLLRATRPRRTIVAVDGAYSMEGDLARLPEIAALAATHGAFLLVDEGHSFGTAGATGRGVVEHFGLDPGAVHLRTGSLNKALPAAGGFLAADASVILLMRYGSAGLAFSGALAPASAIAARAALDVLEREPERATRLQQNSARLRDALARRGVPTLGADTPIVPVPIGDPVKTLRIAAGLLARGVYVNGIVAPGVRPGSERLRCFVAADHFDADLDLAADAIAAELAAYS